MSAMHFYKWGTFYECDTIFKVLNIFTSAHTLSSAANFYKRGTFMQVQPIFSSAEHFYKCSTIFEMWHIFNNYPVKSRGISSDT